MRTCAYLITFLLLAATAADTSYAQAAKIGCLDKAIRLQGEQIKQDFKTQGMEVFKDAMLTMTVKQPYPIAVQLTQGVQYQFIFVGSKNASKLYFEMFDGADKKLAEKVADTKAGSNYIIYSFIPQKTDLYLLVLSQKVKGFKEVCGSFSVLQKAGGDSQ